MVALRTNTLLYDVSFFQFIYGDSGFESGPVLYQLDSWDSSKPLVVRVSLDGPGAAWGLKFTDGSGETQNYILQDGGGSEENKDKLSFRRYTTAYKPYQDPESDDQQEKLEPWKTAYLDYIKDIGYEKDYCTYRLAHIDSDGLPELFISGGSEASGSRICSYKGGKVVDAHLNRIGGASYIPKSGLVHNFNGNMGYYVDNIFRLTDSGFTCVFSARQEDTYELVTNEEGQEEYITKSRFYLCNGSEDIEVTEAEYYDAINEIFDLNIGEALYSYDESQMYGYNEICNLIINW